MTVYLGFDGAGVSRYLQLSRGGRESASSTAKVGAMAKRILLIDDDELVRATIQSILESAGYEVTQAADGVQGLEAYRASTPDLVITDILMPNKEGIETIRDLKRCNPAPRIIAISGGDRNGDAQFLQMAEKLGADRILPKPFRKAALLDLVDGLFSDSPPAG